jgi:hypothetical protein
MSPFLISVLFTAGAVTWIYTKLQRRSGNNTQQSLIACGVIGVVIFVIIFYLASVVSK